MLTDRDAGLAAVILLYADVPGFSLVEKKRLLQSFRFLSGETQFRIYDISGWVPEGFAYSESSFHPGKYSITYRDKARTSIEFARFAPADPLLGASTLREWGQTIFKEMIDHFKLSSSMDHETVVFEQTEQPSRILRLLPLRFRRPIHARLHIWREGQKILAVGMRSPLPIDTPLMQSICHSYETFPS
jgi:hypothetical protein